MHLAATADDGDVSRNVAVDERATSVDQRALLCGREMSLQMKCPGRDFHLRTLSLGPMKRLGSAATALALLVLARPASAHPIPFSFLDLHVRPDAIDGTLIAHIFDVAHDLHVDPPERLLDPAFVARYDEAIVKMLSGRLELMADGRVLVPAWSAPEVVADRQSIRLQVRVMLDRAPGTLAIAASLFPYDPVHQTFVNIYEGDTLTQAILDRSKARFEYFPGTRQGVLAVIRRFVPAGAHVISPGC